MTKKKILIVEDEIILSMEIESRLQAAGYEVVDLVAYGEDAVEKASDLQPDLILMDINLAGEMDGIEAAGEIQKNMNIPILFLTAYSDETTLKRAIVTEPFGYLLKPFNEKELLISIEISLYKHQMERKLKEELKKYNLQLEKIIEERTVEMKEAWEYAEKAKRAKTDFLSTVSHELRMPLTSIRGFASLVSKDLEQYIFPQMKDPDKKTKKSIKDTRESMEIMEEESIRLTELINDLLDTSKIEAGKVEWKKEFLNMNELFQRGVSRIKSPFEQKQLEMKSEVTEENIMVMGDKEKLLQLVTNLLGNAVKFTDNGSITYRIKRENSKIRCEVEDTGIGIPDNMIDKIFEKFKQVENIQTDKPKGTGLGLSICKEIVTHHKGTIWAENKENGKGSRFIFLLPAHRINYPG